MKNTKSLLLLSLLISISILLYIGGATEAQQIPKGQDVGAVGRDIKETEEKKAAAEELKKGKKEAEIEKKKGVIPKGISEEVKVPGAKIVINKIIVTGVTILSKKKIRDIVREYEGRELSLEDFRDIADSITAEYRKNGYVTSFAYLPPQKIQNNLLEIAVIEGRVGEVSLTGNRYFTSKLLLRHTELTKGDFFNYDSLRKNINYINEHPDRNAKVVLAKGAGRDETDVNVEVKDELPLHLTLGYNNYNSTYLEKDKYFAEIKSTNFLGWDHVLSAEVQMGEGDKYELYSGRYLIPFTPRLKMGTTYMHIDQELGGAVKRLKIKGEGDIATVYLSYKLIDKENIALSISPGFDYKQIENKVLGVVYSEDNMRIAKMGLDLDVTDGFGGRSIITQEFDYGLKDFLGGLDDNDPISSRAGAGGEFFRSVTNAARIQALPYSTALMLKGGIQQTSDTLVSTEQFNIGGFNSIRGYPVSEYTGDIGYNFSSELYIPPYFLPRELKVPFTNTTFFDALKFVGFFDWGYVENENPQVGEAKNERIYSAGPALRFDIPQKLSVSFDYGFALGQDPSDGSESRGYIEVKLFY